MRRTLLTKTMSVGFVTLISRLLGLTRDVFLARYLGAGALADTFFVAYQLPNSLRKIFAEGALSASFIPTLVTVLSRDGRREADRFMSLLFVLMQLFLVCFCLLVVCGAESILRFSAPGWFVAGASLYAPYIPLAVQLLRILIFFIMFLAGTAFFAGALQAAGYFVLSSISQIFLNIFLIAQLALALYFKLPVITIALFIVGNGLLVNIINYFSFSYAGFSFAVPTRSSWRHLAKVLLKFLPCLLTVGALELNIAIDNMLVSYLPAGGRSLLYYAGAYTRIPLGLVAVSFASISLPYFSRIAARAPRRLSFYLFESAKFMAWVMLPAMLLMMLFAHKIFLTLLLSSNFTMEHVVRAQYVLMASSCGLFFFAFSRVVQTIFYSQHITFVPSLITFLGAIVNTLLSLVLMRVLDVPGIALATSLSYALQTIVLVLVLEKRYGFALYVRRFMLFLLRYILQLMVVGMVFGVMYAVIERLIIALLPSWHHFLFFTALYWLWIIPLMACCGSALYFSRRKFGIRLHFVD